MLVELTRIEGTKHGRLIAAQMLDVAIRVQAVRAFVVAQMVSHSDVTADDNDDDDNYSCGDDDDDGLQVKFNHQLCGQYGRIAM